MISPLNHPKPDPQKQQKSKEPNNLESNSYNFTERRWVPCLHRAAGRACWGDVRTQRIDLLNPAMLALLRDASMVPCIQ